LPLEAWNTAIDFAANQSSKLKLIGKQEWHKRSIELTEKAAEARRKYVGLAGRQSAEAEIAAAKKAWDERIEKSEKYIAAPLLLLVVEGFEHNGSLLWEFMGQMHRWNHRK
jgi:hypothetical protein